MIKEMTIKAKAKELVEKFLNQAINFPYIDTEDGQCIGSGYMTYRSAKACALITVDVILNDVGAKDWSGDIACDGKNYWNEVKSEINKL